MNANTFERRRRAEEKNNLIKKPFPKAKWIIMDKTTQLDQESSLAVI
tara:strand:- start:85 stop:225 length:141 start_codon:yes stop_codon:yes gene_type:complete